MIQLVRSKNLQGSVRVASFDAVQDTVSAFVDNILVAETCGSQTDALFSFMMLYNELQGTPLSEEPIELQSGYVYVTDAEVATNYDKYWSADDYQIYSEDEIKAMTKVYNPDLTLESFEEIVASYSYEDTMARIAAR